ncbi:MAG: DUF2321 domain-containing protein [Lachnospiraceae bacterium]|nr:DUF2321 domain-containing protein [Lachnospiraceae bacterium]MBD5506005.1 DUF2321 domain-containing protein [Lachnospiraceae bacterium]
MPYDVAQICENGHLITACLHKHPEQNSKFCSRCGAPTINACPHCHQNIKGASTGSYSYLSPYTVPAYCEYCGTPFPWTEAAIQNAALLVQEDEELSEELKSSIVESLPDIIAETPASNLATVRVKKGLSIAGKFTADAIRQFVIDFGCEFAKKSLRL